MTPAGSSPPDRFRGPWATSFCELVFLVPHADHVWDTIERSPDRPLIGRGGFPVPDLTIIACPSCGLPAELVYRFSRDLGGGPVEHARTRCILLHFSSVPVEDLQVRVPEPGTPDPVLGHAAPSGRVLSFPEARPGVALGSRLRDWSRRLGWFAFGALAAVLVLRAPAAIVLL